MNLAAQWLFVIINGSMGLYIFINGVVYNKQVHSAFKDLIIEKLLEKYQ